RRPEKAGVASSILAPGTTDTATPNKIPSPGSDVRLAARCERDFLDVLCQFSANVGDVGVEDRPKVLHAGNNEGTDVAEFCSQRVGLRLEEPCGDLADLPFTVHKCRPESR